MNLKATIEGILFIQGEPLAISRLAKITGAKKAEVKSALRELAAEYRERGIVLVENGEEWQFATNPAVKPMVEKFVTSELSEDLSRASLEVLSIVAYKGPMSRIQVEYIRGVDSSFTLRNLLIRGLVTREENPADRRSYLYRVSADFLKHLGLTKLEELPQYEEFRKKEIEIPPAESPAGRQS
ncbi:MAG: SMC-Scp complex subunit ScpB [Candidatus Sungbacteria bacterium]|uniref:SMC-Scp complex subunit ScpB n=1 Tax=Candidatus Sungiibacteriota bacterium TaxID=2750080 RepID=A0A933DSW8_9BACT|nr:SMC-Scp complex subunit ScpB [Candidatus Sungbacteria bacterium]